MGGLFELGHELNSPDGRVKSGEQETVVATGQVATDPSGSKAANAIGDEPFALLGGFEHAANVPPKLDEGALLRRGCFWFRRWAQSPASMVHQNLLRERTRELIPGQSVQPENSQLLRGSDAAACLW